MSFLIKEQLTHQVIVVPEMSMTSSSGGMEEWQPPLMRGRTSCFLQCRCSLLLLVHTSGLFKESGKAVHEGGCSSLDYHMNVCLMLLVWWAVLGFQGASETW